MSYGKALVTMAAANKRARYAGAIGRRAAMGGRMGPPPTRAGALRRRAAMGGRIGPPPRTVARSSGAAPGPFRSFMKKAWRGYRGAAGAGIAMGVGVAVGRSSGSRSNQTTPGGMYQY